ncbi:aminodeoxychorismate synthase, component I [Rhodoferax koreense]|uniref:Aminodeoxychorismate synthase, component I n=1 Tax=Rhodoferax koreensis TaxID=1842727 RepID=A0A1P8JSF8_9BURK|nr:aminodeoxychorismate synthase component I [Rhodoferax koreense]APW36692.1 aminodeoxychorismate synthase, component I [Rhodoferax koreense]
MNDTVPPQFRGEPLRTLIDFASTGAAGSIRLRGAFGAPRQVLAAQTLDAVRPVLDAAQALAQQGHWCVGYVRYEAAPAFDASLSVHAANAADASEGPLAWFGVYHEMLPWPEPAPEAEVRVDWQAGIAQAEFERSLTEIHRAIADGEVYQVNYTAPLQGRVQGSAHDLFLALLRAQPGGFAACIDTGEEHVLSVSPELFFDWRDDRMLTRPMKGTAPRGATPEQDQALAAALAASAKERAENVMIVDLIRNDLSRVARPFSVRVPRLFQLQSLPSVWQMTSDVEALTREGTTLADVFAALFPCGSVTGAPKVSAMRLIRALEPAPRGVYCGAVGVLQPGGAATFNVPIRTVTLRGHAARCGIGSGITSGATAADEWQEWRHKRAFLDRASQPFELLETLALADGVLRHADAHRARMRQAAAHFGYAWDERHIDDTLNQLVRQHPAGLWRVRLLLTAQGQATAQAFAMPAAPARVRLQLAPSAFEAADSEFVRFKTTRRAHYDALAPTAPGVFDTLLWNRHGEITECTRGNIAVLQGGRWLTPALHCGLLAGVGRDHWLREGRLSEAVLRLDDLRRAEGLAFINSLRGWIDAELETSP